MTAEAKERSLAKMREHGVHPIAIDVFSHYFDLVAEGATGVISESDITPLENPEKLDDVDISGELAQSALASTVIIKLNGGLGTSMGLAKAKTLLEVRDGQSFLDIIAQQVLIARRRYGVRLPVLFMNSFRTQADTLEALAKYPDLAVEDLPLDFLQNSEPKLRADDLSPVEWEADPTLEWCPPGHGDLFTAIQTSGVLQKLLDDGFRYAFVSNGDNLGATANARLAGWFAASGAPFAMEVCQRTVNDRKGGHAAIRTHDGQLVLRDLAMTAEEDHHHFANEELHRYFNSNNLWIDLKALDAELRTHHGVLSLPLIRNAKTVDPADKTSTPVIQIETGMGTACEVFKGSVALEVPRSRFLPVKTTNELMLVRSDLYELDDNVELVSVVDHQPDVRLDADFYRTMADFDARVPVAPSLKQAKSLTVAGDWTFADDVVVVGDVEVPAQGSPGTLRGVLGA